MIDLLRVIPAICFFVVLCALCFYLGRLSNEHDCKRPKMVFHSAACSKVIKNGNEFKIVEAY